MKHNSNILWILLICSLSFSCLEAEKRTSFETSSTDYTSAKIFVEKRIKNIVNKHHLPSFTIVMIDDQEVIYRSVSGVADIEKNIAITDDTYFKIWSVAKSFTAIEIFREIEEGLIDLDTPILNYLPDFSIRSRYDSEKSITIRNLLAHRSGLPRNECISVHGNYDPTRSLEKFERSTHDCYMAFPPETRYKYSNLGYDLLGRIVEENRNNGFAEYMNDKLLKSLGMTKSTFNSSNIARSEIIATGYEYYKGKYYPRNQIDNINSVPSGNLYSTIGDLSIFLQAILANKNIFKYDETLGRMFNDHFSNKNDPETMGLGWKTSQILGSELMIWHDGGPDDGTGALIAFLPERKLGIAMISNSTAFGGNISVPFAIEIFDKMLLAKFDLKTIDFQKTKRVRLEKKVLDRYSGKYSAFGQIMEVESKNNKLKGKISGIGLDLIPVNDTQFRITHWMHKIGLTKIFKPPFNFDKVKIEFIHCDNFDSCTMVINMDNISYEVCPKYPSLQNLPNNWIQLAGNYQIAERLSDNQAGGLWNGQFNIDIDNNVLIMSHPFGPIVPVANNYLIISSGLFAGETMEYSRESGNIIHQNAVFILKDHD